MSTANSHYASLFRLVILTSHGHKLSDCIVHSGTRNQSIYFSLNDPRNSKGDSITFKIQDLNSKLKLYTGALPFSTYRLSQQEKGQFLLKTLNSNSKFKIFGGKHT